mmetsp:Transcript_18043/g.36367  ORF Transcript_18043/g.36367 Transcript_18043/m.36367 type:complete len:94 (-) Transcript_18043:48-329(-)
MYVHVHVENAQSEKESRDTTIISAVGAQEAVRENEASNINSDPIESTYKVHARHKRQGQALAPDLDLTEKMFTKENVRKKSCLRNALSRAQAY